MGVHCNTSGQTCREKGQEVREEESEDRRRQREVIYEKMTPEVRKKLDASRAKKWNNWKHYTNSKWISEKDLKELRKEHPNLKVIPTRWVETDKVGEEPILKSRIVVRGDLEVSKMRTDAPTCSQTMIPTVFALAACRTMLTSGLATFLQLFYKDLRWIESLCCECPRPAGGGRR